MKFKQFMNESSIGNTLTFIENIINHKDFTWQLSDNGLVEVYEQGKGSFDECVKAVKTKLPKNKEATCGVIIVPKASVLAGDTAAIWNGSEWSLF